MHIVARGNKPRKPQQNVAESSERHIMPGLIPAVVRHFLTPRKFHTITATQRDLGVRQSYIISCTLHDLYLRLKAAEVRVTQAELELDAVRERLSVREFRALAKVAA